DAKINALRARQKRNLIATLLLSQGVPMLLAGDELGQTQNGNNNAYCQDNELSWLDWNLTDEERSFLEFVAQMVAFRRRHPVFSRRRFLKDRTLSDGVKEVAWLRPDGDEMTDAEWSTGFNRCFGVYMAGTVIERVDKRGKPVRDNNFLVLFNAHHEEIPFLLPEFHAGGAWQEVIDTANEKHPFAQEHYAAGDQYPLAGRSMAVLIATTQHPALSLRHPKTHAAQPAATPPPAPTPTAPAAATIAPTATAPIAPESAPTAPTVVRENAPVAGAPAPDQNAAPSPRQTPPPNPAPSAPPRAPQTTLGDTPDPGAPMPPPPPTPLSPTTPPPAAPQTPASAAPVKPTEPLPEKLGQDSKGG
ncbi:MAG TPA: hypothetical protein VGO53_13140, partial [Steroidobacteraceae bacterium]|nr:hypothetical protein [Steroidobacteraceae bacterium]